MGRLGCVSLLAATAMALAGQASAAVMEAVITGDWNGNYAYRSWSVDIVYDTSHATESPWTDPYGALGHQLIGDASAVLSQTVTLYGWKFWRGWLGDYDTFTPVPDHVTTITPAGLEIFQSQTVLLVEGYGASGPSVGGPGPTLNLGPIPFDQAGYYPIARYGGGPEPGPFFAEVYTSGITLTVLSPGPATTPEPATWAMMLVGFFAVGSALRRRRHVGVIA